MTLAGKKRRYFRWEVLLCNTGASLDFCPKSIMMLL